MPKRNEYDKKKESTHRPICNCHRILVNETNRFTWIGKILIRKKISLEIVGFFSRGACAVVKTTLNGPTNFGWQFDNGCLTIQSLKSLTLDRFTLSPICRRRRHIHKMIMNLVNNFQKDIESKDLSQTWTHSPKKKIAQFKQTYLNGTMWRFQRAA